jgi:hypothetical protein
MCMVLILCICLGLFVLTYKHMNIAPYYYISHRLRFDEAQLRFKKGSKLGDNFYVRQDGTCSYFFDLEELEAMCATVGLQLIEKYYVRRQYANRKDEQSRKRVWIHAKFVKIQP